jgi:predicted nucleotidyltransferase
MVDPKIVEIVTFFKSCILEKGIHINDLILFGSSSTGSSVPWRDIDIAIISDDFKGKDIFVRTLLTKDAELTTIRKYRIPLDIITLTTDEYQARNSIFLQKHIRKGIPLLSAPPA